MSPGPPGPDPPAGEVLSRRVLDELRAVGGETLVRELTEVFAERTPERLRAAEAAAGAGDLEGVAAAVHSLRSAAGTIGARRLAELAGTLERAVRAGDAGDLEARLARLQREADRAISALSAASGRSSEAR